MPRRHQGLTAALLLSIGLAACAGSPETPEETSGPDPVIAFDGPDREAAMRDIATEIGTVTWYTSLAGPVVTALSEAFETRYPELELVVLRTAQTDLVTRVIQEAAADRIEADVIEVNLDAARLLEERELLAPFRSEVAAAVPDRWQSRTDAGDLRWVGNRTSYVGFAYNPQLLAAELVPGSFTDLAAPELAGQLALSTSTTGVRWVGSVLAALGPDGGEALLTTLAENGLRLEAVSGAGLADLIATGEVTASPGIFRNHALALQAEGAPIEWVPLEPVLGNVGVVGLPAGAPNPAGGLLFAEFLLGIEGGEVLSSSAYPRPHDPVGFDVWNPEDDHPTTTDLQEAFDLWQALFDATFG